MSTKIIIVRHAEAEGNMYRIFHGWTDSQLTDKGHMQAKEAGNRLKNEHIDAIYSSDLMRTRQTAGYIAEAKGLPIAMTYQLREINGGEWEGKPWDDLPLIWPKEYHSWECLPHTHAMPNGETMAGFQARLIKQFETIIAENPNRTVCVVTHGTGIKALLCHFRELPLSEMINVLWCENTAITTVQYDNGKYEVLLEGDSSHLDKHLLTVQKQQWWEDFNKSLDEKRKANVVSWLVETRALEVCSSDSPFWYTSGSIGPYLINANYLYGGEQKADSLLDVINANKHDLTKCANAVFDATFKNYSEDKIYKNLVDEMCTFIRNTFNTYQIDVVSGGERRDWFFSFMVAHLLDKPHLMIGKDLSTVVTSNGMPMEDFDMAGKNVLHIADLITFAFSYKNMWLPAIESLGAKMKWSVSVVDRKQGGREFLESNGIEAASMIDVDLSMFAKAVAIDLLSEAQFEVVKEYMTNNEAWAEKFMNSHPYFLEISLNSKYPKIRERAFIWKYERSDKPRLEKRKVNLVSWLFSTKAIEVCDPESPFWYTSGNIGPYFVNTHYLYGNEKKANDLLGLIEQNKSDSKTLASKVFEATKKNYEKDEIYKGLIVEMVDFVNHHFDMSEVDAISGGERRDWFFSFIVAHILGKPHIMIGKDLSMLVTVDGKAVADIDLKGKKVLHIADLITVASSYKNMWLPALNNAGAQMKWSAAVVDRVQGGGEFLAEKDVQSASMIDMNLDMFQKAVDIGLLTDNQLETVREYMRDTEAWAKRFMKKHPEFLEGSLNSENAKTRERALLWKNQHSK